MPRVHKAELCARSSEVARGVMAIGFSVTVKVRFRAWDREWFFSLS